MAECVAKVDLGETEQMLVATLGSLCAVMARRGVTPAVTVNIVDRAIDEHIAQNVADAAVASGQAHGE